MKASIAGGQLNELGPSAGGAPAVLDGGSNQRDAGGQEAHGGLHNWWSSYLGWRMLVELLVVGALFKAYREVRLITRHDTGRATRHAEHVVAFEQRFHFFTERRLQHLALANRSVIEFLNRYYIVVHFPATIAFLVWLYARHHPVYAGIRNWFVAVTSVALVIHIAYPLAPPRMLVSDGFVDTLEQFGPRLYDSEAAESVVNQIAAMPSLHFGWAVMVAASVIAIKRTRRSCWVLLHPLITLLAIVATANHYWLDALVALLLVVLGAIPLRVFGTISVQRENASHSVAGGSSDVWNLADRLEQQR
ncbi:MAG: hypothetical protein JWL70_1374 [Acidimicrobiia bacterium]|nr:hypothetical protein [Acidimicrobiia bacterium]